MNCVGTPDERPGHRVEYEGLAGKPGEVYHPNIELKPLIRCSCGWETGRCNSTEEARKAKYSGSVTLAIVVDTEGRARDIHVTKSLGMGLDEKAIEAVQKWRFKPGMKGGQAVNVRATIEVNFRLL